MPIHNTKVPELNSLQRVSKARASVCYAPLESVEITGATAVPALLKILDGAGAVYRVKEVAGSFSESLTVGGELGWQRIRLESAEGQVLLEERFRVDATTDLDLPDCPLLALWRSLYGSVTRNRRSVIID